jgi:hypothetical protein
MTEGFRLFVEVFQESMDNLLRSLVVQLFFLKPTGSRACQVTEEAKYVPYLWCQGVPRR